MNLQTTIDLDLKRFFRWWGGELAFLVPRAVTRFLSMHRARLAFTAANGGFEVGLHRDAEPERPAFLRHLEIGDVEALQQLRQQYPELETAEVVLYLTDAQMLARRLYLPEATLENLQQVVGFELDRYTPFTAEQVYYSVTPLGKTGVGQVEVLLTVGPRPLLDELIGQLHALGVIPARIESRRLQMGSPQLTGEYNLLPDQYRPQTNRVAQIVNWSLNSLLFLLLLAVLGVPVWEESRQVDELKAQLKAIDKDTRLVEAQQREIEAIQIRTQRLIDIRAQTPNPLMVLGELTHLLKDDTWLTNFQLNDKHLQIQGQSPTASALISLLEESPYFSKASFVSPLTQDKTTGLERFQITLDVNPQSEAAAMPAATPATTDNIPPRDDDTP